MSESMELLIQRFQKQSSYYNSGFFTVPTSRTVWFHIDDALSEGATLSNWVMASQ